MLSLVIMSIIWLFVTSVLSFASAFSELNLNQIRVFPAGNKSIAGVIQVSYLNSHNQVEYAFRASEARSLCLSLGQEIASKAQVERALSRGLETCRFGWIDEHLAVIPRIHAAANCGKNLTGLVPWRAPVKKKFDVFCFNESAAATQLKDTTTHSSSYYSETSQPPSKATEGDNLATWSASSSSLIPSSSAPTSMNDEAEPAPVVSSAHSSTGAKTVLITCTCGLLLILLTVFGYIKLRRRFSRGSDKKQQQQPEYIQTEEWRCEKNITETKKNVQQNQKIDMDDSTQ
ncbi:lymphatic vessel endothelial hyaluronic acid receptor 1a [Kryptolebias marmoratus]|uniref:Lymphatic vessel endothelial hyaluronic receptor 1a n=1 Tax=Kryptolebias marmoratus TaxID=37003 RepID=A0A3Q2ZTL5_KRYMA|nr:lymphatic vessel endothelial hyaluronic acid receptor 1a [Kryptolebias marmoratus]